MKNAVQEIASKVKEIEKDLTILSSGSLSKEELEKQKTIISSKVTEKATSIVESSNAFDKIETEIISEVVKSILESEESNSNKIDLESKSVPVILQMLHDNEAFKEGGELASKYSIIIKNILELNLRIKEDWDNNLKSIIEKSQKEQLSEVQLKLLANQMGELIKKKIPNKDEIKQVINLANIGYKKSKSFDLKEFKIKVKLLVENFKGK